ncbi:hypothetical protein M1466_04020 [Candidatus Dependentiae bacterium]|nr:hypothetical protein [Candidatus Dependentiae bacterium]
MTNYTDFIAILFRCINLTVFITLLYTIYRRFVHAAIVQEIEKVKKLVPTLEREIVSLEQSCGAVDDALKEQRLQAQLLLQKVVLWKKAVVHRQQEQQLRCEQYQQISRERLRKQQEELLQQEQLASVVPQVLKRAEVQLQHDTTLHEHMMQQIRAMFRADIEGKR